MTDNKVVQLFDKEATADEILERAKGDLNEVLVLSYDKDGALDIRSTNMKASEAAFLCQIFLTHLYAGDYNDD